MAKPAATSPAPPLVVVAVGSNLGDSPDVVRSAIARLREHASEQFAASSLWQTTPVDCPPDSPMFVNAVAAFVPKPDETPESLLARLQALEKEFGRAQKKVMNEARVLDLDLIVFGNETRNAPSLVLPHPRAHQRQFVLQPLSEIAPELVFPGQTGTVRQLLNQITRDPAFTKTG